MSKKLENTVGKFIISILNSLKLIGSIFLLFIMIFSLGFVLIWIPTFAIGMICLGVEKVTNVDTSLFRNNQLNVPINTFLDVFDKLFAIFGFFTRKRIGIVILGFILIIISYFDFREKVKR